MTNVVDLAAARAERDAEQELALACTCDSEEFNVVVDQHGLHLYCTGCGADLGGALDAIGKRTALEVLGYFEPPTVQ